MILPVPATNGTPAFADVPVQRKRLVLGKDVNRAQVGINAVGKCDIDNAVVSRRTYAGLARSRVSVYKRSPAPQQAILRAYFSYGSSQSDRICSANEPPMLAEKCW